MSRKVFSTLFLLISFLAYSQEQGSIQGRITDGELNDDPLIFARVSLKNTDIEAETNFHGNFEFDHLDSGEYTLVISYLGYETIEVPISVEESLTARIDRSLKAKSLKSPELYRPVITANSTLSPGLSGSDR